MANNPIQRGDIFLLDFGTVEGKPIQKKRPALVVQNDAGNRFSPTTIVVAIHHDTHKGLPIQVAVSRGTGGLEKDSVIDCGIVATVDKRDLGIKLGRLPYPILAEVDRALKISMDLLH